LETSPLSDRTKKYRITYFQLSPGAGAGDCASMRFFFAAPKIPILICSSMKKRRRFAGAGSRARRSTFWRTGRARPALPADILSSPPGADCAENSSAAGAKRGRANFWRFAAPWPSLNKVKGVLGPTERRIARALQREMSGLAWHRCRKAVK